MTSNARTERPSTLLLVARRWLASSCVTVVALTAASPFAAQAPGPSDDFSPEQVEFFESKIRPVLVAHCAECHNSSDRTESELAVDHRDGLRVGGRRGPAVVPGDLRRSLLVRTLKHPSPTLRMPQGRDPLPESVIADFERWIEMGAPDPRDAPNVGGGVTLADGWSEVFEERKKWWSFQPISTPFPPAVEDGAWQGSPIDRFLRSAMTESELSPVPLAGPSAVLRRLSFALIGLPPSPEETTRFVQKSAKDRQAAVEEEVDRLIASPHFGERWARHWMDWVRYAESHGSEGDMPIPHAWQYRDYLIRALNGDVRYDQLVREHIAGDQLAEPRIDAERGINESAIGVAQYRFVLHGYSPTDALAEQVRFTDNQIDTISKGFLGLTVSCARCHNHKFDAISQADFYALYGVMASARPATITVDSQARAQTSVAELRLLKDRLRRVMSAAWVEAADGLAEALLDSDRAQVSEGWQSDMAEDLPATHPLNPWSQLRGESGPAFAAEWDQLVASWRDSRLRLASRNDSYPVAWRLGRDSAEWFRHGSGLEQGASGAGEFHVPADGDRILSGVLPSGVYSHTLSTKHSAVFSSPRFELNGGDLFVRMAGDGESMARYVVQNYPSFGETYPSVRLRGDPFSWQQWDVSYWEGDQAYFELSTAQDQPILTRDRERSWIGVTDAMLVEKGQPLPQDEIVEFLDPIFVLPGRPANPQDLAGRYAAALKRAALSFGANTMTDAEARFVNWFVKADLLPNDSGSVPEAAPLVASYRELESKIPVPIRAPGVIDGDAFDQPLLEGGSHLRPAAEVPRRFLEAIDPRPYQSVGSGRLALAESILSSSNPFTARVIVNRLWHHVFGRGLVATPDNLGSMGEAPSHPELLDYLATRFVAEGWSVKRMLRHLVTTRAFQLDARPSTSAAAADPANRLLTHANVRRLDAEAIRDAMLWSAGVLDKSVYGEPVAGDVPRRSAYVRVRRNSMDPFLTVFDAPQPVSTKGRRSATNVPSQALTMMNHPLVLGLAAELGRRVANDPAFTDDRQRLVRLFELALAREPTGVELEAFEVFLQQARAGLPQDLAAAGQAIEGETLRRQGEIAVQWKRAKERLVHYLTVEAEPPDDLVLPLADWDFDDSAGERAARDSQGRLHASLRGEAAFEVADGGETVIRFSASGGQATSPPVEQPLNERSLELWFAVDPEAEAGSLMSLVSLDGEELDSLAFSGKEGARTWLVRGTALRRPRAPAEEEVGQEKGSKGKTEGKKGGGLGAGPSDALTALHLVLSVRADGQVALHLNGEMIGRDEGSKPATAISSGTARIRFGGASGKGYRSRILRARLYDRALTSAEVAASARMMVEYVPWSQVAEWLSGDQRKTIRSLESETLQLRRRATSHTEWAEVAHAMFNLKEFIYLR